LKAVSCLVWIETNQKRQETADFTGIDALGRIRTADVIDGNVESVDLIIYSKLTEIRILAISVRSTRT